MKNVKKMFLSLVMFAMIIGLTACSGTVDQEDTPNNGDEPKYTIAVLAWSLAEEFGVDIITGAEKIAEELNVKIVAPDPAGDMQKEISIIEDLIQQKVDAIAVAPVDAVAIIPYIDKIREAGIVVVDYDIDTDAEVDAKVLSDNKDGGKKSAEYLVEQMGQSGKVLILEEVPGVTTAEERIAGFAEEIAKYPDIEIIRQLSSGTRDTHRSTVENMITAHPDLTGIFAFMGDNTLGAHTAVTAMGRTDILIAGYDASPEQVEILKKEGMDSPIISSIALFPKAIGRVAVETAFKILEGETIDDIVWTELGLLTRENAQTFVDKD